jgi:septum formation protein
MTVAGDWMKRLVLASGSPRRQEILRQLGLEFDVMISRSNETLPEGFPPEKAAMELALQKTRDVMLRIGYPAVIIGADTIVVMEGKVMGKPVNARQAFEMISALSGKQHAVITGIAVADSTTGEERAGYQSTLVRMKEIPPGRIKKYIATGEPFDKAGAYAVQGKASVFIDSIDGCYFNVVGLPVGKLDDMLRSMGVDLFEFIKSDNS